LAAKFLDWYKGGMRKIFLLDDEPDLVMILCQLIELSMGIKCISALSFEEAVRKKEEILQCSDCILDINLGFGKPSGIDMHRWLQENGFTGRIIFLSGHAAEHPLVKAAGRLSGSVVLSKPIEIPLLKEALGHEKEKTS
jgi:FixJ family two-component response regulator